MKKKNSWITIVIFLCSLVILGFYYLFLFLSLSGNRMAAGLSLVFEIIAILVTAISLPSAFLYFATIRTRKGFSFLKWTATSTVALIIFLFIAVYAGVVFLIVGIPNLADQIERLGLIAPIMIVFIILLWLGTFSSLFIYPVLSGNKTIKNKLSH